MSVSHKLALAASIAGVLASLPTRAQNLAEAAPAAAQVRLADEKRYEAMYAGDIRALEGMLSDGLLYTHSSAVTDNKSTYLAALGKGNVVYHQAVRDAVVMHQHGDAMVMAGHVKIDATVDGERRLLNNRFTATWVRDGAHWKLLAWASTAIPAK